MNTPSNNGQTGCSVCERLTPEESAKPFLVMEAILSIPFHDLPLHLVKYLLLVASKSGWGQGGCYASHATMGRETGYPAISARKHREQLIAAGWIAVAGITINAHGHKMPTLVLGARLVAYIRDYLAQKHAAAKAAYRAKHASKSTRDAKAHPDTPGDIMVPAHDQDHPDTPRDITPPDTPGISPIMIPQDITNPGLTGLENRINPPPLAPPPGGEDGGGGGSERQETLPRRGRRRKEDSPATSTQSRYRDLSLVEDWNTCTRAEQDVLEFAGILRHGNEDQGFDDFENVIASRWVDLMEAAKGRPELVLDVLREMSDGLDRGKKYPSPIGFLLTVLNQRSRTGGKTVAAMMSGEKPVQKPVLVAVPAPPPTPEELQAMREQAAIDRQKTDDMIRRIQDQVAQSQRDPSLSPFRISAGTLAARAAL